MRFKYTTYIGFVNYIKGILKNKDYNYSMDEESELLKFEDFKNLLLDLENTGRITIDSDLNESIISLFIVNPMIAFKNLKYMNNKLLNFNNKEINFYYIKTSLNTMLNININFNDEYLRTSTNKDIFYPSRVNSLIIETDTIKVYGLSDFDERLLNNKGLYFIFDSEGILRYIGKSTNSVIKRSFQSVKERKLSDFSKIEYKFIENKSDIGIYEAYYIAKLKPNLNDEFIFDDICSIFLPDIKSGYTIERDKSSFVSKEIIYFYSRVLDISEFLNSNALVDRSDNIEYLEKKGILNKMDAYEKGQNDCVSILHSKNLLSINDITFL